jgi:RND family efflux transporter MFP subunit
MLTANNDPLCQVDRLQIRLKDGSVADKAGIKTEAVALRRISTVVEFPGEIAYDGTRLARVTPRVKGVIARAVGELGSAVKSGDVLAVIDSPALGEAKSRYIELREKYLLAQVDFERAKLVHTGIQPILDQCETMTSAEEVRKKFGEVRIGEAKSRLLKSHADLELTRATFERESRLREQKISSEQAYETARGNLHAAEAQFHATHEEIAFTAEREHLSAEKMLHIAKNALDVAERQLHILGIDHEAVAALETTPDTALLAYELRSPLNGRVVERHAVVGESVDEKDALYTVADLSSVWLMLDVPERDLIGLRIGLPILFTVDGLPGNSFQGTLTWISSQVDDRTRTVKARADLPNDTGVLRANMFGRARVVLHDHDEVLTIPDEAVQTDGCCQLVFVQESDALYRPRKVALGAAAGGYVEIHKGLQIGEVVVTAGSFLMKTEILKGNIGAGCCEVDPGR